MKVKNIMKNNKKINLEQLATNKTKLKDFINVLVNGKNQVLKEEEFEIFENIDQLLPEIIWFSGFIHTTNYQLFKRVFSDLFWFSGPIGGESSYVTVGNTLIGGNIAYPSFIIGDIATGKKIYEIILLNDGKSDYWGFSIYSEDGCIDYDLDGMRNRFILYFGIDLDGKRVVKQLSSFG